MNFVEGEEGFFINNESFVEFNHNDGNIYIGLVSKKLYFQLDIKHKNDIEKIYQEINNLSVKTNEEMEAYLIDYENGEMLYERYI